MTGDGSSRRTFFSNSATADSLGFNPLGAATILLALSKLPPESHAAIVLDDIAKEGVTCPRKTQPDKTGVLS